MDSALLIHAIVRQTTVLLATLATASGQRAQLTRVASLVFADLARELREQGLGNKVIADMFGMALRTYHRKLARLSASRTLQGRSLWEAVLGHVQEHGPLLRTEVLRRFARDDEAVLRAVIADLIDSGLVCSDSHDETATLSASALATKTHDGSGEADQLEAMLLVTLHRRGPMTAPELAALLSADPSGVALAADKLVQDGVAAREQDASGAMPTYRCDTCVIPLGGERGWEAAVFDHYQAMVVALVTKLRAGKRRSSLDDAIGGSTFTFDLWRGHPMEAEVVGLLKRMREQGMQLRRDLEAYNSSHAAPPSALPLQVTSYVGQSVLEQGDEADD